MTDRNVAVKVRVSPEADHRIKAAALRCGCSASEMVDLLVRALSLDAIAEVVRDQRAVDAEERDRCSRPLEP